MLHIIVDRKSLLRAMTIVENAVTENKIREVLSGIYIETQGEKRNFTRNRFGTFYKYRNRSTSERRWKNCYKT